MGTSRRKSRRKPAPGPCQDHPLVPAQGFPPDYAHHPALLLLIPVAIMLMLPFLWMLSTSLKVPKQIFAYPPIWIPNPIRLANYYEAWFKFVPFTLYLRNSLIITLGNIAGNLFSCCLAAYGFARLRRRGRNFFFILVLATMMVPMWVTLIPQYVMFSYIHWTNTFAPLMVPAWFGWPFFIFLLRQFFMTIPRDLDEARVSTAVPRLASCGASCCR